MAKTKQAKKGKGTKHHEDTAKAVAPRVKRASRRAPGPPSGVAEPQIATNDALKIALKEINDIVSEMVKRQNAAFDSITERANEIIDRHLKIALRGASAQALPHRTDQQ